MPQDSLVCGMLHWCYCIRLSNLPFGPVFTARRYAGAVFAVFVCPSVCPSVCLSQAGVISKQLDKLSCFLA